VVSISNALRQMTTIARDVVISRLGASYLIPPAFRWRYLRLFGLKVENSMISAGCYIGGKNLAVGARSFVNYECFFDTSSPIKIGSDVQIGMRCQFITSTHEIGTSSRRGGPGRSLPIVVGDGAWIGAGVLVLPGVHIGRGAIIAAGSVLTRDVPDDALIAGVPGRHIRQLP
jgi:maltose O-acetyltransferase